ncbi:MAG TPA: NosD domain-containing protein [Thermodesulfobacteriota bacterium]
MCAKKNFFNGLRRFGAACSLLAVVTLVGWSSAQADVACGDTITEDTTLTHDLLNCPGNGIVIGADNITLNCNRHTISGLGPDGGSIGIALFNRAGVVVKKCSVERFDFGIVALESVGNKFLLNRVSQNSLGFDVGFDSFDNILAWNKANDNDSAGFFIVSNASNQLIWNTASGNTTGFQFASSSNKIIWNKAIDNLITGFLFQNSDGNKITLNKAIGSNEGFILVDDSDNNILLKNKARSGFMDCINTGAGNIFIKNDFGGTNECPSTP